MSPTFNEDRHGGLCQCGMCRPNTDQPKDTNTSVPGPLYYPRPGRTYQPKGSPLRDFTPVTAEEQTHD